VIGRFPFSDTNHRRFVSLVLQGPTFPVNRDSTKEFQDLVTKILKREKFRIGFAEIRNVDWLRRNDRRAQWSDTQITDVKKIFKIVVRVLTFCYIFSTEWIFCWCWHGIIRPIQIWCTRRCVGVELWQQVLLRIRRSNTDFWRDDYE